MKKLILLAAVSCIGLFQLTAQVPDKTKTNLIDTSVIKPFTKYTLKDKDAPVAERGVRDNCCAANPFIITPCTQSLLQSFKNLTTGTGVSNCHPTLNFPSVSFAMPENCFSYQTTSASMVTYSSFYIPESEVYHGRSSEFRVIWGSSPGNFSYYGVCPPNPIIFPHPGLTENHVFGAKLIKQSDYRAFAGPVKDYNTMAGVPSLSIPDIQILAVYMEQNGGYISRTETSLYNSIYSSKGIVVNVKQRGGPNVLCYLINNYDGAGTLTWKENNPACGDRVSEILPVAFTNFTALPDDKIIKLKWSVQNEQTSKGFEIQRSQTTTNDFKRIGWSDSKSNGNGSDQYVFADKDVQSKLKYYYRLKQIDNDGRFTYSPIKTAFLDAVNNSAIQISPNPVLNTLQVYFYNSTAKNATIKITDANGAVLQTQNEYAAGGKKIMINTSSLPAGNYVLVIEGRDGTRYAKPFLKM